MQGCVSANRTERAQDLSRGRQLLLFRNTTLPHVSQSDQGLGSDNNTTFIKLYLCYTCTFVILNRNKSKYRTEPTFYLLGNITWRRELQEDLWSPDPNLKESIASQCQGQN